MRSSSTWLFALLACSVLLLPGTGVAQPLGVDLNRDCQTIRSCRFTAGGVYRGCLSSYSCRICRLVAARCSIDPGNRVCQRMVCTWG
jgi:hypothetical protein